MNQLSNLLYHREHVLRIIQMDVKDQSGKYDHMINELIILAMKLGAQVNDGGLTR